MFILQKLRKNIYKIIFLLILINKKGFLINFTFYNLLLIKKYTLTIFKVFKKKFSFLNN